MKLDEYLETNCVLTGSRAMGFVRYNSDYDYAVTQKQVNDLVKLRLLVPEYTKSTNTGYEHKLRNDYSIKFYNNNNAYLLFCS